MYVRSNKINCKDGSVNKVLPGTWVQCPEPTWTSHMWWWHYESRLWEGRDSRCWVSPDQSTSSKPSRKPVSESNKGWNVITFQNKRNVRWMVPEDQYPSLFSGLHRHLHLHEWTQRHKTVGENIFCRLFIRKIHQVKDQCWWLSCWQLHSIFGKL